jgi:hypothetical protein
MPIAEIYRKAQRLIETSEAEEARYLAARALRSLAAGDIDLALEDLGRACWLAA